MLEGKVITVWSHRGNVGNSITAINLAKRLSELHGKTILVDLNLKNPRIADYLVLTDMNHNIDNLYSYVAGQALNKDIIDVNIDVVDNLHILKGTANIIQSDYVNTDLVTPIIAQLKALYDYVVIDCSTLIKNLGTNVALNEADMVVALLTKDIASIMSFHEIKPLVFANFNSDKFIFCLNMDSDKVFMQKREIEGALEVKIDNSLPMFDISNMNDINKGQIAGMLAKKENVKYVEAIDKLIANYISSGINTNLPKATGKVGYFDRFVSKFKK